MRLADYLSQTATTQEAFAKAVGTTQGRISQILKGGEPSLKLARRIKDATKGAVDFLAQEAAE